MLEWRCFIWLTGIIYLLTACGGEHSSTGPKESPDIKIQVVGAAPGTAYLIGMTGEYNYRLDSARISADDRILFKREEPYPSGMLFVLLPDQSFFQMLVDTDQTFSLKTRPGSFVESMEVEGSLDNELLYESLRIEGVIQPKIEAAGPDREDLIEERDKYLNALFEEFPNTFFTAFKRAGQNPPVSDPRKADGSLDTAQQVFLYRSQFWDNVDFNDERLLHTPVIANKLLRYITKLTPQQHDSIIASTKILLDKVTDKPEYFKFFANRIAMEYEPGKATLMDSEAVFVYMVQNYFTREKAFWADSMQVYGLQQRAGEMSSSLIGKIGPDVVAKDPQGIERSLHALKAPYLVVYMYNPTCEHCIEETPKLVEFYRNWKSRGVEVFAIALDTDEQTWKSFISQNNMDWINVFDPTNRAFYGKYFVDNTPEVYVLDPDRLIIGKNLKVSQIGEVIEREKEGD